jgi:hypothetical protein
MQEKDDGLPITWINRLAVICYLYSILCHEINWVLFGPLILLKVDVFVAVLPFFECYLLSIFISYKLALHISSNRSQNNSVSSLASNISILQIKPLLLLQSLIELEIVALLSDGDEIIHSLL